MKTWNHAPTIKTRLACLLLVADAWLGFGQAAVDDRNPQADSHSAGAYAVTERAPHSRTWERVEYELAPGGRVTPRVHRVIELGTGLCYPSDEREGVYLDSDSSFELAHNDAFAVARHCQHKLIVSHDGQIDLLAPDGARFRGSVVGLVLTDVASGRTLQVAAAKTVRGELIAPNVILFPDAFEGLQASVRIRNELGQVHHEILLAQKISPQQLTRLGFTQTSSLRLQVWSEFVEAPTPVVRSLANRGRASASATTSAAMDPDIDHAVNFGALCLGRGIAFVETASTKPAVVRNQWIVDPDRQYLVETCEYNELLPLLKSLPEATLADARPTTSTNSLLASTTTVPSLNGYSLSPMKGRAPVRLAAQQPSTATQIAKLSPDRRSYAPEVVLDYVLLYGNSQVVRCQSTATYFLTSPLYVNTLVLEGGTVLKVTNNPAASIIATNIICETDLYRPAIITCRDQNGVGENVPGSTGNPSGYYGGIALDLSYASSPVLSNIRFSYLSNALAGTEFTLRNCQILHCKSGFAPGVSHPNL